MDASSVKLRIASSVVEILLTVSQTVLANLAPVFASGWTIQASAPYTARFHSRGEAGVKRIAALHAVCQRWTSGLRDGEAALHFLSALNAGLGGVFPVSVGATASLRVAIQLVRERRFGAGARTIRQVEYVEEGDAGMVPVTPMALLAERRRREFQESERVVRLPLAGL